MGGLGGVNALLTACEPILARLAQSLIDLSAFALSRFFGAFGAARWRCSIFFSNFFQILLTSDLRCAILSLPMGLRLIEYLTRCMINARGSNNMRDYVRKLVVNKWIRGELQALFKIERLNVPDQEKTARKARELEEFKDLIYDSLQRGGVTEYEYYIIIGYLTEYAFGNHFVDIPSC